MSVTKISLREFCLHPASKPEVLICSASYESRCLSIPRIVHKNKLRHSLLFVNENLLKYVGNKQLALQRILKGHYKIIPTSTVDPIQTTDALFNSITQLLNQDFRTVLIDITTFTHEALLIVLRILVNTPVNKKRIFLCYNGASEYSIGLPREKKWLSKGIEDIRSVIGYPGLLLPDRPTHLIVLVGYEHERARKLIEAFQPALVSLGHGKPGTATSKKNYETNIFFHNLLVGSTSIRHTFSEFEFSANDPIVTQKTILKLINDRSGYNHIIAPMNTKISTISCALIGIRDPSVQICYAQPRFYNYYSYSRPSKYVYLMEWKYLLRLLEQSNAKMKSNDRSAPK